MFFFLILLMSLAGLVIWALLLGIGWRAMLAIESLVHAQREILAQMQKQQTPVVTPVRETEEPHVVVEK